MKNKITSEARFELKAIYEAHDVAAFREFVSKYAFIVPQFKELSSATDEELSHVMHEAKSQLIYLGEFWQDSRNQIRMKNMWDGKDPGQVCGKCEYFQVPPVDGEMSCMHMGSTPLDVICKGFKPLHLHAVTDAKA